MKKIIKFLLSCFTILSISSCGGTEETKPLIEFKEEKIVINQTKSDFEIDLNEYVELAEPKKNEGGYILKTDISNIHEKIYNNGQYEYAPVSSSTSPVNVFDPINYIYSGFGETTSMDFYFENPVYPEINVYSFAAGYFDIKLTLIDYYNEQEYVTTSTIHWDGMIVTNMTAGNTNIDAYYGEEFKLDFTTDQLEKDLYVSASSNLIVGKDQEGFGISFLPGITRTLTAQQLLNTTFEVYSHTSNQFEDIIISVEGDGVKLDYTVTPKHKNEISLSFKENKVSVYLNEQIDISAYLKAEPIYVNYGKYEVEDNSILRQIESYDYLFVGQKIGTTKVTYSYDDKKCSIEVEVKDRNVYPTSITLKDSEITLYRAEENVLVSMLTEVTVLPENTTFETTYSLSNNKATINEYGYLMLNDKGTVVLTYTCHDKTAELTINIEDERPYDKATKYTDVYNTLESFAKANVNGYEIYRKVRDNNYIKSVDTAHLVYDSSLNSVGIKVYHYSQTLTQTSSSSYEGTVYLTSLKTNTINMEVFALWSDGNSGGAVYSVTNGTFVQEKYTGYQYGISAIGIDAKSVYNTAKEQLDKFIKTYTKYRYSGITDII